MKLAVLGASGKMGKRIVDIASKDPYFTSIEQGNSQTIASSLFLKADLIIEFTRADATLSLLTQARHHKKPYILGTTGHTPFQMNQIKEHGSFIPLLISANFSRGISVLQQLIQRISSNPPSHASMKIVETHHRHKKDAPSGTAIALTSKLPVPIESIRDGEVIGKHQLVIEWEGERLEITHESFSRDVFAIGAIEAAKKLIQKPPGLYELSDIF